MPSSASDMVLSSFSCWLIIVPLVFIACVIGWERQDGCYEDTIRLQCQTDNILVIKHAFYATSNKVVQRQSKSEKICQNSTQDLKQPCNVNLRLHFNKKCSGQEFCRFNIKHEVGDLNCSLNGRTIVEYRCIPRDSMNRFCGEEVTEREGYIHNPGYPTYYPPLFCNWTIKAQKQQKIFLEILDLSMKKVPKSSSNSTYKMQTYEQACDHYLRVMDNRRRALHICGESVYKLTPISIDSENVSISLYSDAHSLTRGFLLYFKVIGCPKLSTPENGYLVREDGQTATVMCCLDYVFADSLDNRKVLQCIDQYEWSDPNLECVEIDTVIITRNLTEGSLDKYRDKSSNCSGSSCSEENAAFINDVVIPSTIIILLIIINAIIVVFILHKRRKLKNLDEEEESLHESSINQYREPSTSITSAATSHG